MKEDHKQCIRNAIMEYSQNIDFRLEIEQGLLQFLSSFEEVQQELLEADLEHKLSKNEGILDELLTLLDLFNYWEKLIIEVEDNENLNPKMKDLFKICARKQIRVEFLLEEPSMENFLKVLLPKILPRGFELDINCFLHAHQGKTDL